MPSKREIWAQTLEGIRGSFPFGPLKIKRDVEGRLHCESGPAYISPTCVCWYVEGKRHGVYADTYGTILNYFRGILIPKKFATNPEKLTVEEVLLQPNAEVRYAGLEIYGYERMMEEGHLKTIHEDHKTDAKLFKFETKSLEEPLTLVRVKNGTPEYDGEYKHYFIMVPPQMKTCAEAIAWTFRKTEKEYHPNIQT
jgi:hypothetical protein